jgi:hypothetical protein
MQIPKRRPGTIHNLCARRDRVNVPVMIGAVYSTAACGKLKNPELPAGITFKLQL